MNKPALSYLIATRNKLTFLREVMLRLLHQRRPDEEIVVVDGGSTDGTPEFLERLTADGHVQQWLSEPDLGEAHALNKAVLMARAPIIKLLTDDDAFHFPGIRACRQLMESRPDLDAICTDGASLAWELADPFYPLRYAGMYRAWQEEQRPFAFCCLGYMFRRESLPLLGLFHTGVVRVDAEYTLRVTKRRARIAWHTGMHYLRVTNPKSNSIRHAQRVEWEGRKLDQFYLDSDAPAGAFQEPPPSEAGSSNTPELTPEEWPKLFAMADQWLDGANRIQPGEILLPKETAPESTGGRRGTPSVTNTTPAPSPVVTTPATVAPSVPTDTLAELVAKGLATPGQPLRLHLGCGEQRFQGYVNIDYPPSEHNVMAVKADYLADITRMDFPPESVDEIRLHHVFEHFSRVTALAMLVRWHRWLKPGGVLHIETPDFAASANLVLSNQPWRVKMGAIRHLAGDQAAAWAYHVDHWFPERYNHTLQQLGFDEPMIATNQWERPPFLANVEVRAAKKESRTLEAQIAQAEALLWESTVADAERPTWTVWCGQLRNLLAGGQPTGPANTTPTAPAVARNEALAIAPKLATPARDKYPLDYIHGFNQTDRDTWVRQKAASVPRGARVLDVGAGTCPYKKFFSHCVYKAHDFKKYEGEKLGGTKDYGHIDYASDITAIPVPDHSFDVVICTEVFEHIPEPIAALREIARIVKPGGRVFLTAPLGSGLHQLPFHFYGGYTPEWYRLFGTKFGLEIKEVSPNGGFFRLLAQECARVAWTFPQHQHLHGDKQDAVLRLFGEILPKYLFSLEDDCFIEQFTVGYHVEMVSVHATVNGKALSADAAPTRKSLPTPPESTPPLAAPAAAQAQAHVQPGSQAKAPGPRAVAVVFSKDRPLQVDATLSSLQLHCRDIGEASIVVLHAASTPAIEALYGTVAASHPSVLFKRETAFKADLLDVVREASEVLLMVDDNIVVRDFSLRAAANVLGTIPKAIGFSLRLGRNTTFCYPLRTTQALPVFTNAGPGMLQYTWPGAALDFGYPLEVSSTLYRGSDLRAWLARIDFSNPNTLEANLMGLAPALSASAPLLVCPESSLTFCAPFNRVQDQFQNRTTAGEGCSAVDFLKLYADGSRMDVAAYANHVPNGCHQDVALRLSPPPAVSVVIPCYKQAALLPDALGSVVAQTLGNWEAIVVNDGSPDETGAVARDWMLKHPGKIRLVEKSNGGLSSARNVGFKAARAPYVFTLDADDKLAPTLLEKTKSVLDANAKVGFAYGEIQHFGALDTHYPLPDFDKATLIGKDNIVCCGSLVRKTAWLEAGGYKETMREGYEDWDFWITCVEKGWIGHCIHEPLFLYRKSGQSMLTDANSKRPRLIATIVTNHPALYDEATKAWAAKILAEHAAQRLVAQQTQAPAATPATTSETLTPPAASSSRKLRVTYLINSIQGVTGGNQTLLRQANALAENGHRVSIVTYTPRPDWFNFKTDVVQVPAGKPMAAFVPESDVVVSTYFANTHELLAVKAPVKVYYAQGDQFVFADADFKDTAENRMLRELSQASYQLPGVRFVANSNNLARAVEAQTGRKPDAILPVCTDQQIFRPLTKPLPGSRARILIVGPDTRGTQNEPLLFKGIQDIHDALKLLAQRYPNFTAVRMSSSPPEIFAKFPCEFYIAPSDEMKTVLYGTAHVLIYASHYDSCPRPPQEAMAAGCPVVCTATDGAKEYCRDGENSLLVPIRSPQAIADAVFRVLTDAATREKLVQGGLATAGEFPREREWREWEDLLLGFAEEAPATSTMTMTTAAPAKSKTPENQPSGKGRSSVELPPAAWQGNLKAATAQLKAGRHLEAFKLGVEALKQRPFNPDALLLLAEAAAAAGDTAKARSLAERAQEMAPGWHGPRRLVKQLRKAKPGRAVEWPSLPGEAGSPRPPLLSVCLIAKNEERFLGQCLRSVQGLAAQIVLVDTGSTDRTVEIARGFGAEIHTFPWTDDFSAARNAALEHARGEWVLILDADEELPADQHAALQRLMAARHLMGYRLALVNTGLEQEGKCYVPRLFRNAVGLFYFGRIHEQIFPSIVARGQEWGLTTELGDATLVHHGYTPEITQSRQKVQRNLRLLEKAVIEWPDDPNLAMNLGLETVRAGDIEAGLIHYRRAYRMMSGKDHATHPPELKEQLLTQFTCQLYKVKAHREIVEVLDSKLGAEVMTASMSFVKGLAQFELGDYASAARSLEQCLATRNKPALSPVSTDIRTGAPSHALAVCYERLGQLEKAARHFADAVAESPALRSIRLDFARFQAATNRPVEALQTLHALVAEDPKDQVVWHLGGRVALSRPDFKDFALDWTGEAVAHHPDSAQLKAQRIEALMLNSRTADALALLRQCATKSDPGQEAALILCQIVEGDRNIVAPSAGAEPEVSQRFLQWYRRLLVFEASAPVVRLNAGMTSLNAVLPTAAKALGAALSEARAGD